jgi:hypothetical protein
MATKFKMPKTPKIKSMKTPKMLKKGGLKIASMSLAKKAKKKAIVKSTLKSFLNK